MTQPLFGRGILKKHVQSVNEGVRYDCSQCEYKATQQVYLVMYKQLIYEGVWYDCNYCEYKAKNQIHLTAHIIRNPFNIDGIEVKLS